MCVHKQSRERKKARSSATGKQETNERHTKSAPGATRVAVCCSVLQCVAVCCSVMRCVAVCCSALQCIAVFCNEERNGCDW